MVFIILITATLVIWLKHWWSVFIAVAVCAVIGAAVGEGPGAFVWGLGAFFEGWLVYGVRKLWAYNQTLRRPKG